MTTITELMAQAIDLAREQYGEREYTYQKVGHAYRKHQWYTTISPRPTITRQEYDDNVVQGETDELEQFRGKLKKSHYYTYRRDKVRDGWQDALIAIIKEAS